MTTRKIMKMIAAMRHRYASRSGVYAPMPRWGTSSRSSRRHCAQFVPRSHTRDRCKGVSVDILQARWCFHSCLPFPIHFFCGSCSSVCPEPAAPVFDPYVTRSQRLFLTPGTRAHAAGVHLSPWTKRGRRCDLIHTNHGDSVYSPHSVRFTTGSSAGSKGAIVAIKL